MSLQLAALAEQERRRRRRLTSDENRRKHDASRTLLDFCKYVDPSYLSLPHLLALQDKLNQVESYITSGGKTGLGRLIVNMPPRHGKSQTVSKRWPAYLLGLYPTLRVALIAYQSEVAEDFSRANNFLIRDNDRYHEVWPDIRINRATSAIDRWSLSNRPADDPSVVAVGLNGALTGRGFNLIIIDDPIKSRAEADSPTYRRKLKEAYIGTIRPRLEPGGAIVLVCTRWHEDDLAGYLIERARSNDKDAEHWEVLNLPAIAQENDALGRAPGEALWPERFSERELAVIKATIGDYDWYSEYQGLPTSPGGAIFQRDWWKDGRNRYDPADPSWSNACVARWLSFDTAIKDNEANDYSACTVGELTPDYRLVTRQVWKERLQFPDLPSTIEAFARRFNRDGKLRAVLIEDKGSGTSAIQTLRASSEEWLVNLLFAFPPVESKEQRARQAAVWCRNGCVLLPRPSEAVQWLADFEHSLFNFPSAAHDDDVDSFTQLILYIEHLLSEGFRARGATPT